MLMHLLMAALLIFLGYCLGRADGAMENARRKVGAGGTATVTRAMLTAAHGVTLESGDVVLSARLLERIYTAMAAAEKTHNDRVEGRDAALSRRVPSHDGLCVAVDTEKRT